MLTAAIVAAITGAFLIANTVIDHRLPYNQRRPRRKHH